MREKDVVGVVKRGVSKGEKAGMDEVWRAKEKGCKKQGVYNKEGT